MSFTFIVNPRSANGATLRKFDRVRSAFADALGPIDVRLTERPRHATELARAAVKAGAKAVIAVGGDGTNNEVVNGFFDEAGARLPGATAFGVVTSGTGGDFRRSFGWTLEPMDDLARLRRFTTRTIDVGRVTCTDEATKAPRTWHFVNIGSFGLSGSVVDVVNHSSKALGAKLSFMVGSARAMVGYQPPRVRIALDDGPAEERALTFCAVANGQYFGGSMWVAPDAVPDDGQFDAVVVEGGGVGFFVKHGLKIYAGTHTKLSEVKTTRCRKVHATPVDGARVMVEIDGEQPGVLPATFDIVPHTLPLLV